jgi:hypothetical protein
MLINWVEISKTDHLGVTVTVTVMVMTIMVTKKKSGINLSCEDYYWGQNAITLDPYPTGLVLGALQ